MEADLAQCLNDAADLVEGAEWLAKEQFVQTMYKVDLGRSVPVAYCMVGAIRHACPSLAHLGNQLDGYDEERIAKLLGFSDLQKGFTWNDRKKRTQAEVVARLRLGSERARAGVG